MIYLHGTYGRVRVTYRIAFDRKGVMVTDYTIDEMPFNSPHNQAFNECGHDVGGYEEVGLAFDIPAQLDSLSWKRRGMWSVYPQWHTNRLEGTAKKFAGKVQKSMQEPPAWDWKEDEMEWTTFGKFDIGGRGTYDFRSMKNTIYNASMHDGEGHAFYIFSDGTDSVRAEAEYAAECTYNDDDPALIYSGSWLRVDTRNRSYRGEHMMSCEAGSKMEFTFDGTGCIWYGTKDIICGTAKVYLDGEYQAEIDLGTMVRLSVPRGYEAVYHEMIYAARDLEPGRHKLVIEVTGNKGVNGQNSYVTIDRIIVLGENAVGNTRFIVDNEFNYPDLTWGCYYKEPILVVSGYTRRVTAKLG